MTLMSPENPESAVNMNTRLHSLMRWTTAMVCAFGATTASAQLRISINGVSGDSIQVFSEGAMGAFELTGVTVTAKGNAVQTNSDSYRLPITEIYLGPSKYTGLAGGIVKGGAIGTGLLIARTSEVSGKRIGLTLANFRIDYHRKQVLADVTPLGGKTTANQAIYNFKVLRPMVQEPNAQGKLALEEVLGNLIFTPETLASLTAALELDELATFVISELDNGKLVQKIDLTLRAPVPTAPYVPL
jgi:hypothetical protein